MKNIKKRIACMTAVAGFASLALLATGCQTTGKSSASSDAAGSASLAAGGAQLWSQNCQRCHNFRSPSTYSDAQWDVAVHHMRVRGNLTAQEHRSIAEFLKSAN